MSGSASILAIDSLYQQVLGRDIDPATLSLIAANRPATVDPAAIRMQLAQSPEAALDIARLYQNTLGRNPTAAEIATAQAGLLNGQTLVAIRQVLGTSAEAANTIAGIYSQIFGRQIDSASSAIVSTAVASGLTLTNLRTALAGSPEIANDIISDYQRFFGRPATGSEVGLYQQAIAGGASLGSIQQGLAFDAEPAYGAAFLRTTGLGAVTSTLFGAVDALLEGSTIQQVDADIPYTPVGVTGIQDDYQAVLGRYASPAELPAVQAAESNGQANAQTLASLAALPEAAQAVTHAYTVSFGAPPPQSIVAASLATLASGATSLAALQQQFEQSAPPVPAPTVVGFAPGYATAGSTIVTASTMPELVITESDPPQRQLSITGYLANNANPTIAFLTPVAGIPNTYVVPVPLSAGTYSVDARAVNADTNNSAFSAVFTFVVQTPAGSTAIVPTIPASAMAMIAVPTS